MEAESRPASDRPDLRQVFDDLVRFETVLWNEVDARLRQESGLPLGSLNVMMVIERTPGCRVNDIADSLEITVGGTSQAVDRLAGKGLCARRANPADRRSSIVELTDAGSALLRTAIAVFDRELESRLRQPLSTQMLDGLAAGLATLRDTQRRAAAAEPDARPQP